MGLTQTDTNAAHPRRGARSYKAKNQQPVGVPEPVADAPGTLTLITSDGETIVFDGMDIPIGEATALASEDALGKIWNRPAEDLAWRDV